MSFLSLLSERNACFPVCVLALRRGMETGRRRPSPLQHRWTRTVGGNRWLAAYVTAGESACTIPSHSKWRAKKTFPKVKHATLENAFL